MMVGVKLLLWLFAATLTVVSCAVLRQKRQGDRGPLYDYVYRADPNYHWTEIDSVAQDGFTTYTINITTQKWYNETFTNRPIWWHYLVIHVPNTISHPDSASMYISFGSNNDRPPSITQNDVFRTGEFANATGIVSAVLQIVPNQPIIFENDGVERYEDQIIAWTWRRFFNESLVGIDNPEVLLYMPMCKASARAMDAIQEFVYQKVGNSVSKFMVAGQSKRGWTTWLMGGIDDRIVALAPVVLSCLNMVENFHHYYRSLGGWSFAMYDYWMQGLMGNIDETDMVALQEIIDPYFYRQWLTMPKLMISGASDEFFMADDYDYFYDDLLGEKYIWIIENSGHGIDSGPLREDYWLMLQTFYISVLTNYQRPHMEWVKNATDTGGQIILLSPTSPLNITSFYAQSVVANRRDWRTTQMDRNGNLVRTNVVWIEKAVEDLGNSYYRVQHDNPAEGYLAFFIKASGVEVDVDCKSSFLDIKLGHKYRYITFTLSRDLTKIIIQKMANPDATYDEFVKDMRDAQSASECRYAVYDMPYRNHDGQQRTKLIFFMWSPEEATVKQKMVYSSSKDALKKALGEGIGREIQANDMGDLDLDNIMEIITRSERR